MIFGIDASLTNTAIVYGDGKHMNTAVFPSPSKTWAGRLVRQRVDRINDVVNRIMEWVEPNCPPQRKTEVIFFIESYSYNSMQGGEYLGELGGVLRVRLSDLGTIYEVAPTTLKKFVTGKGNGKKIGMVAVLSRNYNVDFDTDDEYDAFGLYLLGLVGCGVAPPRKAAEVEAAETVMKEWANVLPIRHEPPNSQSVLPF